MRIGISRLVPVIGLVVVTTGRLASQDRPANPASAPVTVTGCVQRLDESGSLGTTIPERTPTPDQAGVPANPGEPGSGFILTDATPPPATGKGQSRTTRSSARVRYLLDGEETELERYQGQRVRARGTLPSPSTKPAETAPVGTSGSTQVQSNIIRLKVTSIARVAGGCK